MCVIFAENLPCSYKICILNHKLQCPIEPDVFP